MNAKQRYFANVRHAMRDRRMLDGSTPQSRGRTRADDDPGAGGGRVKKVVAKVGDRSAEAAAALAAAQTATLEFEPPDLEQPEADRARPPATIEIKEAEDALKAIVDIRDVATRAHKRGELHGEVMKKLSTGLDAVVKRMNEQTETIARLSKRSPLITGDAAVDLRNIAFRLKAPKRVDRAYYNLMALSPEELSYASMLDTRGAYITPHMAAFARSKSMNDTTKAVIYEAQAINDMIIIVDQFMARDTDSPYGSMSRGRRIRQLRLWRDWQRVTEGLRDVAMDTTTSGEGSEWVPTILSSQLHEIIYANLVVAGYFDFSPMPSKVWDNPVEGADATAFLMPEGTVDPDANKPTASLPATRKMTLTAQKLAARCVVSWELEEDAVISMVPYVLFRIARALARARETAIINGQKSTTIDTADVPGSFDARKAWDGFRVKQKAVGAATEVDLSTMSAEALAQMKGVLKEYGQNQDDGLWVGGYSSFIRLLTLYDKTSGGSPILLTNEKFGPNTTFKTGQLGMMFGSPFVVSQFCREDLNASGIFDNVTTTKTILLYTNRRTWQGGERRTNTIRRSDDLKMETDQILVMGTWRGDFEAVNYAGTQRFVALGKNIASF